MVPVEPVSISLAVLAFVTPVYESCNAMYRGCKRMRDFGQQARMQHEQLKIQHTNFELLMTRKVSDMMHPFALVDEHAGTMKEVMNHLRILQTQFTACNTIITNVLSKASTNLPFIFEQTNIYRYIQRMLV